MNKSESELLLIGAAFLLTPIAGCAVAFPLLKYCQSPMWPIITGTIAALGLYIGACALHSHLYRNVDPD